MKSYNLFFDSYEEFHLDSNLVDIDLKEKDGKWILSKNSFSKPGIYKLRNGGEIKAFSLGDTVVATSVERGKLIISVGQNLQFPELSYLVKASLDWDDGKESDRRELLSDQIYAFSIRELEIKKIYNVKLTYYIHAISEIVSSLGPFSKEFKVDTSLFPSIEVSPFDKKIWLGIDMPILAINDAHNVYGYWNGNHLENIPIDFGSSINFPPEYSRLEGVKSDSNSLKIIASRYYDLGMTSVKFELSEISVESPSFPMNKEISVVYSELAGINPSIRSVGIFSINFFKKEEFNPYADVSWGDGTRSRIKFYGEDNVKTLYVLHDYNLENKFVLSKDVEIEFEMSGVKHHRRIMLNVLRDYPEGESLAFNRKIVFPYGNKSCQLLATTDNPNLDIRVTRGKLIRPFVFEGGRFSIYYTNTFENNELEVTIEGVPYLIPIRLSYSKPGSVSFSQKDGRIDIIGIGFFEKKVCVRWDPNKIVDYDFEDNFHLSREYSIRGDFNIKVQVGDRVFRKKVVI